MLFCVMPVRINVNFTFAMTLRTDFDITLSLAQKRQRGFSSSGTRNCHTTSSPQSRNVMYGPKYEAASPVRCASPVTIQMNAINIRINVERISTYSKVPQGLVVMKVASIK